MVTNRTKTIALWVGAFIAAALLSGPWRVSAKSWWCGAYGCSDQVWMVYSGAARHFFAHQPLYNLKSIDEFQYFPQAAMVFFPFQYFGASFGGLLWRAVGWTLFASGMARLSRTSEIFWLASLIAIGPSLMSLLNGQANLLVAAAMMHAASELGLARFWRVAIYLALALALKPIALVMILLVAVQYKKTRLPSALMMLLVALAPFAVAPSAYVFAQYRDCWDKLALSARPTRAFEDFGSLVARFGLPLPHALQTVLALGFAAAAVWLCVRLRQRWREPAAAILCLCVAGEYLMLWNPRTQPNSYVLAVPVLALATARLWLDDQRRAAGVLAAIALAWCGALSFTAHWLRPLGAVVFGVLVVREIVRPHWFQREAV